MEYFFMAGTNLIIVEGENRKYYDSFKIYIHAYIKQYKTTFVRYEKGKVTSYQYFN